MIEGVDVSHHQGEVDWAGVSGEGVSFAVAKATEGGDYTDPRFAENWQGIADAGIPFRGAYHFFRMTSSPSAQADNFGDRLEEGGLRTGDMLALDIERKDGKTGAEIHAAAAEWVDAIHARFPDHRLLIYSGHFWRHVVRSSDPLGCELWLPAYVGGEWVPDKLVPSAWTEALIWQYSSKGSLSGIGGNVDVNRCRLSEDELGQWLRFELEHPVPAGPTATYPTLRRGDRGEAVSRLQQALAGAGFLDQVDGIFGPDTETAVKRFQADRGLREDGIAGSETWGALNEQTPQAERPLSLSVDLPVDLVEPPSPEVCWAAGATALVGWRNRMSLPIELVLEGLGGEWPGRFEAGERLTPEQFGELAEALGLIGDGTLGGSAEELANLLLAQGPQLLVDADALAAGTLDRVRVLHGLEGDGSADGTALLLADSAGGAEQESLGDFGQAIAPADPAGLGTVAYRASLAQAPAASGGDEPSGDGEPPGEDGGA